MLYVFAFRNFCLDLAWMPKISNAYILWDFAWFQCPWFLETFWKTVWNPSHPARNACPRWRLQTLSARHNIWILSWLSLCDHSCLIMFNLSALIPIPPGSPSTKIMPNCSQNRWGKLRECHVKSIPQGFKDKKFQILHTVTIHHHKTTFNSKNECFSYCSMLLIGFKMLQENIEDHFAGTRHCKDCKPFLRDPAAKWH